MEHQYPGAISGDEHMLAELMLPDQAHVRHQDWTIFFLHKDTSEEEVPEEEVKKERKKPKRDRRELRSGFTAYDGGDGVEEEEDRSETDEEEQEEMEGGEGPPLIYVLNLVNTKQDTSAKRCLTQ